MSTLVLADHEADRGSMRQLSVLMATVFVDMMGFAMVLPLLPFYAKSMGAQDWMVGPLVAIFSFAQLAVSPLWGRLSDRSGRRPMILAGLLLSAVAYVLFGLAHSLWVLFLCRLVQGIGGGTTGVVQAYVSDAIAPAERARALGWVTAATSAGVMIGPLIGSFAYHLGPSAPGFLAAGLCVVNFLFAGRWLPEPLHHDAEAAHGPALAGESSLRKILEVLRHPASPVGSLIWVYAIGMMAFMAMNSVFALYLQRIFDVTAGSIGPFYAYIGGVGLVMRAILLGPTVRRFGEVGVMRLGTLALVLGMAVIPLPSALPRAWQLHVPGSAALAHALPGLASGLHLPAGGWSISARMALLVLIVLLVPVGTALLFPSTTALVSRRASRGETGQIMGVQQTFGGVARLVGPLWATSLFGLNFRYPFWASALLMVGGGFLTSRLSPEPRAAPAAPRGRSFPLSAAGSLPSTAPPADAGGSTPDAACALAADAVASAAGASVEPPPPSPPPTAPVVPR